MSSAVVAVVVLAALACPLHMLLRMRRGRHVCPGLPRGERPAQQVRRRQRVLERQLAELRELQAPRADRGAG